ncbi:MAG: hypothetical protein ACLP50_00770 [Solirubrobacteraceae bacterium]
MERAGTGERGFTAELAEQDDPPIGQERIRVRFDDGRVEELRLHDYDRLYSLPGVYEAIVSERLGCRSPAVIAGMLAGAADRLRWDRAGVRVLDVAAGNGVSGEALSAEGLVPVIGTDIVPAARAAALRDRPGLYERYVILDLLRVSDEAADDVRALGLNALCCVAPVGEAPGQLPPPALAAAAGLLAADALIAYMYDPRVQARDPVTPTLWASQPSGASVVEALKLAHRHYVHRRTVNGLPYEMIGVVWRVRRASESRQAE